MSTSEAILVLHKLWSAYSGETRQAAEDVKYHSRLGLADKQLEPWRRDLHDSAEKADALAIAIKILAKAK